MKNGLRGHISEYVTIQIRAVKSRNGGNHVSDFSVHAYVKVGKSNFSKFPPVTFRQTPDMFSGVLKVKWCAALSSVVRSRWPFGQIFCFNANV